MKSKILSIAFAALIAGVVGLTASLLYSANKEYNTTYVLTVIAIHPQAGPTPIARSEITNVSRHIDGSICFLDITEGQKKDACVKAEFYTLVKSEVK